MTITEFLLARIAEDEEIAKAAMGTSVFSKQTGQWVAGEVRDQYGPIPLVFAVAENGARTQVANFSQAWERDERRTHITLHDPARVLAECAAKRAIIKMHEDWPVLVESAPHPQDLGASDGLMFRVTQQMQWLTSREYVKRFGTEPPTAPMLAALAAVYKDHPDYREEWA